MTSCSPVSGDFECQCQGSWGGATCSVCTLNCNDGHATDDCTQCKCDDNHGGVLCEWSFDTYSVVLGVSIVVIPSEAMGRFKRLFEYDVAFALRIPADRVEVRDVGTMGGRGFGQFSIVCESRTRVSIFLPNALTSRRKSAQIRGTLPGRNHTVLETNPLPG